MPSELVVCAYNVERGIELDRQLRAFEQSRDFPRPDVLLLSEADRCCTRSDDRNIAREYAAALEMDYVFGVEFVELPRRWGPGGRIRRECAHGNAIVSRFPLGDVRVIRHSQTRSWHSRLQRALHVGQPRLGGRIAVSADITLGDQSVRLYAVHFESGRIRVGRWNRDAYRLAQARELIEDAAAVTGPILIGGDMNTIGYLRSLGDVGLEEPVTAALFRAGYLDAHASLPAHERITTDSDVVLDLITGRSVGFSSVGVGSRSVWGGLSDHLPVWAAVDLQRGATPRPGDA